MALEVMFSVLGMIFEPYAIGNLPILLGAVSDRKREATCSTGRSQGHDEES